LESLIRRIRNFREKTRFICLALQLSELQNKRNPILERRSIAENGRRTPPALRGSARCAAVIEESRMKSQHDQVAKSTRARPPSYHLFRVGAVCPRFCGRASEPTHDSSVRPVSARAAPSAKR
jgi:hypothetical protein